MFDILEAKNFVIDIAPILSIDELETGLETYIQDDEAGENSGFDDLFVVLLDNKLKFYESFYEGNC